MSRRRKPYTEALKELLRDAERLDFIEKHCSGVGNHVGICDGKWGAFITDDEGCGNSSGCATIREAIDKAITGYKDMSDPSFESVMKRLRRHEKAKPDEPIDRT